MTIQTSLQDILKGMMLSEGGAPYIPAESVLQDAWTSMPLDHEIVSGVPIKVLSRGHLNRESGPDFKGAKIEISGRVLCGDVELHRRASDWLRHGHGGDPAYAKVILHVVASDDLQGKSPLRIPCFVMPPSLFMRIPDSLPEARDGMGVCSPFLSSLPPEGLHELFRDAGLERLRLKANTTLLDMIKSGAPSAWLSKLSDAMGFKRNRDAFSELLRRYMEYPEDTRRNSWEAVLWGESGLLPDPSTAKLDESSHQRAKELWNTWWTLRRQSRSPIEWIRSGSRPLNSPERRVAALASLIARLGENPLPCLSKNILSKSPDAFNLYALDSLAVSDPFWNCRTSFEAEPLKRKAASIGRSKVLELAVDVLMPSLLAFSKLNSDAAMALKVEAAYLKLPATEPNRVFSNALQRWTESPEAAAKALDSAASRQGVIHIYKIYCAKASGDCNGCVLASSLKNHSRSNLN